MEMNQDFKDLLSTFNDQDVEYLVVGAHALAAHGHVRATKDFDVFIKASKNNAEKVIKALSLFGAPLLDLSADDLANEGTVFQIGVEPIRIDVINSISGVSFDEAWPHRMEAEFAGVPTHVISKLHLIRNKKASGRSQDLADVEWLEKHT